MSFDIDSLGERTDELRIPLTNLSGIAQHRRKTQLEESTAKR